MSIYTKLLSRHGGYSLPFLLHLYNPAKTTNLFFCNSASNITYNGITYQAAAFSYSANIARYGFDGGGKLEISAKENGLIDLVEFNKNVYLEVTGIMNEAGTISTVKGFSHKYGKITGDRNKITFSFNADDRPDMTFPSLIWSTQNNRGNS